MQPKSLGYRTDLALLHQGGAQIVDHGNYLAIRSPHNPTYWWGNFLLLAEIPSAAAAAGWLEVFAAEFPDAEHVAIGFDGTDGTVEQLEWFTEQGFGVEAQTVMTATEVREPRHGAAATIRQLSSDRDWAQSVELRMRCNAGQHEPVGHRTFVTAKAQTNRALVARGVGAWFGAFVGDLLVSQLGLVTASPGSARYQSVETDPDHRRQGLAGALVARAAEFGFEQLRARTLVMVADPHYFAIDLYRSVGFSATESQLQIERAPEADGGVSGR